MAAKLITLLFLALTAQSALSALVARLQNGNVRLIPNGENRYSIRITHSDGSVLDEIVDRNAPGVYQVTGRLRQTLYRPKANLVITDNEAPRLNYIQQPQQPLIYYQKPQKMIRRPSAAILFDGMDDDLAMQDTLSDYANDDIQQSDYLTPQE